MHLQIIPKEPLPEIIDYTNIHHVLLRLEINKVNIIEEFSHSNLNCFNIIKFENIFSLYNMFPGRFLDDDCFYFTLIYFKNFKNPLKKYIRYFEYEISRKALIKNLIFYHYIFYKIKKISASIPPFIDLVAKHEINKYIDLPTGNIILLENENDSNYKSLPNFVRIDSFGEKLLCYNYLSASYIEYEYSILDDKGIIGVEHIEDLRSFYGIKKRYFHEKNEEYNEELYNKELFELKKLTRELINYKRLPFLAGPDLIEDVSNDFGAKSKTMSGDKTNPYVYSTLRERLIDYIENKDLNETWRLFPKTEICQYCGFIEDYLHPLDVRCTGCKKLFFICDDCIPLKDKFLPNIITKHYFSCINCNEILPQNILFRKIKYILTPYYDELKDSFVLKKCNDSFCDKYYPAEISCNEEYFPSYCNKHSEFIETKECPSCNILFERIEGCDYIKCNSCEDSFCYVCLQIFPKEFIEYIADVDWKCQGKCSDIKYLNDRFNL